MFAFVAVVVLLVVVLLQAWFYNWKVDLLAQRTGPIDAQQTPAAIAQKQLERIETYGWADPKTQARAIPIEPGDGIGGRGIGGNEGEGRKMSGLRRSE